MNTKKQHKKQMNEAVTFTGLAKFTNAENLQLSANRDRRGLPTQLIKLGFLLSRKMPGGQLIFGLSKAGADSVGVTQFDIHKVTLGRVQHAVIAQYETLIAVKALGVLAYEFEPQAFKFDTRPDVIWTMPDLTETYVEVELSAKTSGDGDLDKFFLKLLSRKTIVIFNDEVLLSRYIKAARGYIKNGIPNWKHLNGKWVKLNDFIKFERDDWCQIEFKMHKVMDNNRNLSFFYDAVGFGF